MLPKEAVDRFIRAAGNDVPAAPKMACYAVDLLCLLASDEQRAEEELRQLPANEAAAIGAIARRSGEEFAPIVQLCERVANATEDVCKAATLNQKTCNSSEPCKVHACTEEMCNCHQGGTWGYVLPNA
jgi:hypothetical protein